MALLGGFSTAAVTRRELAEIMVSDCLHVRVAPLYVPPKLVFSSNGQGLALAGTNPQFAHDMQQAEIIHADGMPVVIMSRVFGARLPERIATTDFFHDAAQAAIGAGLRFFFLGSSEDENRAAVEAVTRLYPELIVAGRHHGYFDDSDDEEICERIRESGTDVLWVALGKPRQERWAVKNRSRLSGVAWIKTCGGLYAFLSGRVTRSPRWMQRLGLEWLYRAAGEPTRLGWRYLTTNPYALYRLLRYSRPGRHLDGTGR